MEIILYYIQECKGLLLLFLLLLFSLGLFTYIAIMNFNQEKKLKVILYGLFLEMKNIDIIKISCIIIRCFLMIYILNTESELIMAISLLITIGITLIEILCNFKRVFGKLFFLCIQMGLMYFMFIINTYIKEVEITDEILIVRIFLMIFIIVYTIFFFFREIELITKDSAKRDLKI